MTANRAEGSKRKAKKLHISGVTPKKERFMLKKQDGFDVSEELYPLRYYMHNREEMVNQAFAAIGKKDLKALLFPAIEHLPLDELKLLCLGQLQEMSDREVATVLEGKKLSSSPVSPWDADDKPKDTERLCFKEDQESLNQKQGMKTDLSTKNLPSEDLETVTGELMECTTTSRATCSSINIKSEKNGGCSDGNKEKLMLEVLELEMRARAIRALLQYHKDASVVNDFEKNITP